eukprot:gene3392-6734_t
MANFIHKFLSLIGLLTLMASPALYMFINSYLEMKDQIMNSRRLADDQQSHKGKNSNSLDRIQSLRNIFVDLGTNNGMSLKFFLGMESHGMLDRLGGNASSPIAGMGSNGLWDVYVFEANPKYNQELIDLKRECVSKKKVKSFHLFNHTAIGTKDGFADFYYDNPDPAHTTVASTLMKESSIVQGNPKESVRVMSIVTLLKNVIRAKPLDNVVLKIDVEGSEYDIMRKLFSSGVMRLVDKLAVEYHHDNKYVLGNPLKKGAVCLGPSTCCCQGTKTKVVEFDKIYNN